VRDKDQSHTYVRIHKNVLTDEGCGSGPHESGKVRLSVSWVPMGSLLDVQPMRGFDHFVCMSNLRNAHAYENHLIVLRAVVAGACRRTKIRETISPPSPSPPPSKFPLIMKPPDLMRRC